MKLSRKLTQIGAMTLVIFLAISALSFVKAPKKTLKEIALEKQAAGEFIPVYIHPTILTHKGVGADPAMICSAGESGQPVKDQFGTDYFVSTRFEETLPESYFSMAESVANQLNEGLGTTAFKAVSANDVPMKTVKVFSKEEKIEDWWSTSYDVVVNLWLTPFYITRSDGKVYKSHFEFSAMLGVNTVDEGKQALGNMGPPANLNTLKTDDVSHETCFSSLGELEENVSKPDVFADNCFDANKGSIDKFIEKENKKYDKAKK